MTRPSRPGGASLLVAVATALANVLAYGLSVVVSRRLGPEGFGEVAPLLAIVIVASVPGQALQAGVARRSAARGGTDRASARLLLRAAGVGLGVALLALALAPALRALLDLSGWTALLWTAASTLPATVCFACLGVLQGAERFGRLSVALVVVQAARLAGGTSGVVLGGSAAAAMAGTALGLALAAVGCLALASPGALRHSPPVRGLLRGFTRDTAAVLSVVVLTSLDVLLARNRLSPSDAGLYAAGALVAKVAFFGPSFVAVVLYPRFARAESRRRALRLGGLTLGAAAAVAVGGALVGRSLVPLVLGADYVPVEDLLWAFAAAGSALAGVFLLVQAGLAVHDHRLATAAYAVAAVEVAVILSAVRTIGQLVSVVLGGAVILLAVGCLLELRQSSRGRVAQEIPTGSRAPVG